MRYVIGLTGKIASGKSCVSRMLWEKGAYGIDADKIARDMLKKGAPAYISVVQYFGGEYLDANGEIDRHRLGQRVFSSKQDLLKLNELTHPPIIRQIQKMLSQREGIIVLEAVYLIGTALAECCNEIWVVEAPEEVRLSRIMARDGLSKEDAWARICAQKTDAENSSIPVYKIPNTGGIQALGDSVDALYEHVGK